MKKFLKRFLKNPKTVWSIVPSSAKLTNSMLRHIDFSKDLHIVEFWPWIWSFTHQILKRATKDSKLIVFEIHEDFIKELEKIEDPRIQVVHWGAETIWKYVTEKSLDVIISWLPFWSLPKELTKEILSEGHKHMKMWWTFIQFQYFLQNRKDIHDTFKNYSITWQPINFPPAFVYKCHKIH
jgi:phospholipid N-methyltransferase